MGERQFGRLLLLCLTLALSGGRLYAATPTDEKGVEADIDEEDDGSPEMPPLKKIGQDSPSELTPPPAEVEAPAPPAREEAPVVRQEEAPAAPVREPEPEVDRGHRAKSGAVGEPRFDWSKHVGESEVEHPFAAKGLLRINKDRTYMYKVKESDQTRAMSFGAGIFNPTNLQNPDEAGQVGSTFKDNYSQTSQPAFMLNYEWQLWQSAIGKFGLKLGTGFYMAQGNGHFVGGINAGLTPREVFTFVLVPVNLGAVYRFQFYHHQLFVPYVDGGGTVYAFSEFRDDNKPAKFGGSLGAYAAGGVAFNLTYFDALSRIQLDREYSINAVYLTAEFRQLVSITRRYDFTSNLVNAGFLMEY